MTATTLSAFSTFATGNTASSSEFNTRFSDIRSAVNNHAGLIDSLNAAAASGFVNVLRSGLVGDGSTDETAALQAILTAFNVGSTNAQNPTIYFPAGRYRISSTLTTASNVAYFNLVGDGGGSSSIEWFGSAGEPMFKFSNCRGARIEGLAFVADSTKPSYGLQFDKPSASSGPAPMYAHISRCRFALGNNMGVAVGFTNSGGSDSNNEQSVIDHCEFNGCDAGIRYEHSNSLWHKVTNCDFESCTVGISNYKTGVEGGGFTAIGCNFANTVKPLELGPSRYPIQVIGCNSEGSDWAVYTPEPISTGFGGLHIVGGLWYVGTTLGSSGFKWDCNVTGQNARCVFDNITVIGSSGAFFDFPGSTPVTIKSSSWNGDGSANTIKYAGFLTIEDYYQAGQLASQTTAYSTDSAGVAFNGGLCLKTNGSAPNPITMPALSGNDLNVRGYPDGVVFTASYGGATTLRTLSNGLPNQRVTIIAGNGNLTVNGFAGLNLAGSTSFVMTTNSTLTLAYNVSIGWFEISRSVA